MIKKKKTNRVGEEGKRQRESVGMKKKKSFRCSLKIYLKCKNIN